MNRFRYSAILVAAMALVFLAFACLESGHSDEGRIANGIERNSKFAPQWSQAGDRLIFAFNGTVYSANVGERDLKTVFNPEDHKYAQIALAPQISPSGDRVVFSVLEDKPCFLGFLCDDDAGLHWTTVVTDISGSDMTVLKKTLWGSVGSAVWSPDGTHIAFMSDFPAFDAGTYDGFGPSYSLFTMNADGSDETNRTPSIERATAHAPAWSPDGQRIAFRVHRGSGENVLTVLNLQDSGLSELGKIDAGPSWSPDGRFLAFRRTCRRCHSPIHSSVRRVGPYQDPRKS